LPSLSTSAISFFTSYFLGSKPRARIATLSSFESMYPENYKSSTHRFSIEEIKGFLNLLFLFFSEFVSGLSGRLERSFFFFERSRHLNYLYLNQLFCIFENQINFSNVMNNLLFLWYDFCQEPIFLRW
jgi:hypothetical protein